MTSYSPLFDLDRMSVPPTVQGPLTGDDVLSVKQFDRKKIDYVFFRAREMEAMVDRVGVCDLLRDKVAACIFYEPSTRTSSSFIAAMQRLGGTVIPITSGVSFSSVSKGETLADTMRVLEQYADVIVLRHPQVGAAAQAAEAASVPILNAGDGPGEHPTQALLDLYTIQKELGKIDGLKIAMVGDLRFGRTVHSLTKLLLQ
ncbi:MAG: aspartate carbamoyltransferase, partial [Chloroflexota bacterium]